MKTAVRNTSIQAFHSIDDLGRRQKEVYEAIGLYGSDGIANFDIARIMNMPINSITPRVNELVKMGAVIESHREPHPITGKRAIYWALNIKEGGQQPLL